MSFSRRGVDALIKYAINLQNEDNVMGNGVGVAAQMNELGRLVANTKLKDSGKVLIRQKPLIEQQWQHPENIRFLLPLG
jgi:hypothetical protein